MKLNIKQAIEQLFPREWSKKDITRLVAQPRFDLDVKAIDMALNHPIRDLLVSSGKHIRPRLFVALLKGFGLNPRPYLDFAVLLEAIHNGTLAVDDIEDRSDLRRGRPALHKTFGIDVAINAGNALYFLPLYVLLGKHESISDTKRLKMFEIYAQEMIHLHIGQALDIHWHTMVSEGTTKTQYLEMARLKTGALTRMTVRFASIIAEQQLATEQALISFAELAGIAYQIRDDVLDLTTDTSAFGKPFGNDITEGKMSLPIIIACSELPMRDGHRLREILRMHTRDKVLLEEARGLIMKTRAIQSASDQAEQLIQGAWDAAREQIPEGEGRDMLRALVSSFTKREY